MYTINICLFNLAWR